jgi:hypothetical protein
MEALSCVSCDQVSVHQRLYQGQWYCPAHDPLDRICDKCGGHKTPGQECFLCAAHDARKNSAIACIVCRVSRLTNRPHEDNYYCVSHFPTHLHCLTCGWKGDAKSCPVCDGLIERMSWGREPCIVCGIVASGNRQYTGLTYCQIHRPAWARFTCKTCGFAPPAPIRFCYLCEPDNKAVVA